jgi:hypothetical protein
LIFSTTARGPVSCTSGASMMWKPIGSGLSVRMPTCTEVAGHEPFLHRLVEHRPVVDPVMSSSAQVSACASKCRSDIGPNFSA